MTTPTSKIAQAIFDEYYLQNFNGDFYDTIYNWTWRLLHPYHDANGQPIHRMSHGAGHAGRVGALIPQVHALRAQLDTSPHGQQNAKLFTDGLGEVDGATLLQCVQIAGFFHDAARQNEGKDKWDRQSAIACKDFLLTGLINGKTVTIKNEHGEKEAIESPLKDYSLETKRKIAQMLCAALCFKDDPLKFEEALDNGTLPGKVVKVRGFQIQATQVVKLSSEEKEAARYFWKLIKDSDCIEVMRCRKYFDIGYLEIYKELMEAKKELESNKKILQQDKAHNAPELEHIKKQLKEISRKERVIINFVLAVCKVLNAQGELEHPLTIVKKCNGKTIRLAETTPANRDPAVKGPIEFAPNVLEAMKPTLDGYIKPALNIEAEFKPLWPEQIHAYQQNAERREAMLAASAGMFLIGVGVASLTTSWTGFGMIAAIACLAVGAAFLVRALALLRTPPLKLAQDENGTPGLYYYRANRNASPAKVGVENSPPDLKQKRLAIN